MPFARANNITGTASELSTANPVLRAGQTAFATDTGMTRVGDGSTAYNSLAYGASPSTHVSIAWPTWRTSVVGVWKSEYSASDVTAGQVYNTSNAQNDEIVYEVPVSAGTWAIDLLHRKDANRAIVTVQLDDGAGTFATVGTVDEYNGSATYDITTTFTGIAVTGSAALRKLKLKAATRNASASGWYLSFSNIRLRRTA